MAAEGPAGPAAAPPAGGELSTGRASDATHGATNGLPGPSGAGLGRRNVGDVELARSLTAPKREATAAAAAAAAGAGEETDTERLLPAAHRSSSSPRPSASASSTPRSVAASLALAMPPAPAMLRQGSTVHDQLRQLLAEDATGPADTGGRGSRLRPLAIPRTLTSLAHLPSSGPPTVPSAAPSGSGGPSAGPSAGPSVGPSSYEQTAGGYFLAVTPHGGARASIGSGGTSPRSSVRNGGGGPSGEGAAISSMNATPASGARPSPPLAIALEAAAARSRPLSRAPSDGLAAAAASSGTLPGDSSLHGGSNFYGIPLGLAHVLTGRRASDAAVPTTDSGRVLPPPVAPQPQFLQPDGSPMHHHAKSFAQQLRAVRTLAERSNPISYTGEGYIASYSPARLFSYGYLWFLRGSVLTDRRLLTSALIFCVIAILYAMGVCDASLIDRGGLACGASERWQPGCRSVYGSVCFHQVSVSEGLILGALASFLMGIFCTQTLNRWWTTRDKVGFLIGVGNNFAIMLSTYVPGLDPQTQALKSTLMRWTNLAHGLVYTQAAACANGMPGTTRLYGDLRERGLINDEELDVLTRAPAGIYKYALVYAWCAQLLLAIATSGRMAFVHNALPVLQNHISVLRGNGADVFMYLNNQIPYIYSHILTLLVKAHLLFVAIVAGGVIGRGMSTVPASPAGIVWGLTIVLVNVICFEGVLCMHASLVNPFGPDPNDFPVRNYLDSSIGTTTAIMAAAADPELGLPPLLVEARALGPPLELAAGSDTFYPNLWAGGGLGGADGGAAAAAMMAMGGSRQGGLDAALVSGAGALQTMRVLR